MAAPLHISISAEKIFSIGGLEVTNSILTSLLASLILIAFALAVRSSIKSTARPSGLQNFAEWLIEMLYGLVHGVTGSHAKTRLFFPYVASFFLFILLNNWLGLLPGVGTVGFYETVGAEHAQLQPSSVSLDSPVAQAATTPPTTQNEVPTAESHNTTFPVKATEDHGTNTTDEHSPKESAHQVFVPYFRAGTADLNTTLALGFISVFMTQVFGVQFLKLSYFKKFINFSSPINFFIGLLEAILEMAKVISFAFRLFGNIFAGEVLLAVIAFLVPVIAPMPFYGVEVAVGVIQALVFAMLSVVFFNMAVTSHDEH